MFIQAVKQVWNNVSTFRGKVFYISSVTSSTLQGDA
jgi:hypothetical protein